MTTQTLQEHLSKLNQAPQVNNIYIAFDDSSSVTADQYNMIKIFVMNFSNLILSLKQNFFRTSIIKYDNTPIEVITNQVKFEPETAIKDLDQRGGAVNFVAGLTKIKELSDQVQGNKTLFLFTNGSAIDKSKILELCGNGIEIFCFLVLENGQTRKSELVQSSTFLDQKVILLPNLQTAQNFFNNLVIQSGNVPQITIKDICLSAAILNISGIDDFQNAKFTIKNMQNGLSIRSYDQTLKTSREITLNLNLQSPKYRITVQGVKINQVSQVSSELELTLTNRGKTHGVHPITQIIQNPNSLRAIRDRVSAAEIPECLRSVDIDTLNIGLFGDMGNGKSSLINTFCTAIKNQNGQNGQNQLDHIEFPAIIGKDEKTITKGKETFSITESINVFDAAGMQPSDNSYNEIDYLTQGRLRNHYQQGGVLNQDNKYFQNEADLNLAPHVFIYVVDIETAMNDDSIGRFWNLSRLLRSHHIQIFVALTKLDMLQENNNQALDDSDFGQALENGAVKKFIQAYSKKANLSVDEIFPIFNYTGSNQYRSEVKDALGLILLDQAVHAIETYFKRFIVVKIIDQNEINQGSFLLQNPDMLLEQFNSDFRDKIKRDNIFVMKGFYKDDRLIPDSKWKTMVLKNIKVRNETTRDGFKTWTLKLHNEIPLAAPNPLEG